MLPLPGFKRPDFSDRIEARLQDGDQQLFPAARGGFAGAFVPFNAGNPMQQANDPAWQAFRVCDAITAEPLAQIFGFADIQNAFRRTTEKINAGCFWQLPEKIFPKPLDQRFGMRKKPELI